MNSDGSVSISTIQDLDGGDGVTILYLAERTTEANVALQNLALVQETYLAELSQIETLNDILSRKI